MKTRSWEEETMNEAWQAIGNFPGRWRVFNGHIEVEVESEGYALVLSEILQNDVHIRIKRS